MAFKTPINVREQEDVPGRVDMNPALGNLFRQAPAAIGNYIKNNAMGGMFRENAGEEFGKAYEEFSLLNPNESGPITPEQSKEIGSRSMDLLTGGAGALAGTIIGPKSVSGIRVLNILEGIVPGAKEAFEQAPRIRQAMKSGEYVPPHTVATLMKYDNIIKNVHKSEDATKVLDYSGFSTEDATRNGFFSKAVSDEMTEFKPGIQQMIERQRKKFASKDPEAKAVSDKMTNLLKDSVIHREYPELAERMSMSFEDMGSLGRRGSMDAHFMDIEPDKTAKGTYNLLAGDQQGNQWLPSVKGDRWKDKLLGTVVHEGDHAVAGFEGQLGGNFNMDKLGGRQPMTKLFNMIKDIPEDEIANMRPLVQRLRTLADMGMNGFEAGYKALAHETAARTQQRHFLGEGPLAKYSDEGFEIMNPGYMDMLQKSPEDLVIHPSYTDRINLHKAAGGTTLTEGGFGMGFLFDKFKQ